MDLTELLGMCTSTRSLPAMKFKSFGADKNIGISDGYDTNKFCKNGKIKRNYRRRRRTLEQRRFDFMDTKRKLLAQRSIVLPKYMTKKKLWTQSLISFNKIENAGKCKRKKTIMYA